MISICRLLSHTEARRQPTVSICHKHSTHMSDVRNKRHTANNTT